MTDLFECAPQGVVSKLTITLTEPEHKTIDFKVYRSLVATDGGAYLFTMTSVSSDELTFNARLFGDAEQTYTLVSVKLPSSQP